MNKSLPTVSVSAQSPVTFAGESIKPAEASTAPDAQRERQRTAGFRARQSGKLHSRFAGYMAFGAAVFVSIMAAFAVASHDLPLMLGGF